jgi:histidinol-phosphatase (PHP family)
MASTGLGFSNYHTHTRHCDGNREPEEFVEAALRKGMPRLGFSGHNVVPFPAVWTMPAERLPDYLRQVREVKARFHGRIEVFLGMEADYLPGITSSLHPRIRDLGLDYVIGSVHFIAPLDGEYSWTVDGTAEELDTGLRGCFGGDIRALVELYYRRVAEMAETTRPDIIGHMDIVKKNNRDGRYFSEDESWYRSVVMGALEAVAHSGSVVELNTGGVVRNTSGALHPSEWILREALRLRIPVMVNADAHWPDHIDGYFAEAVRLLKDIGFRTQRQLTSRGWVDEEL